MEVRFSEQVSFELRVADDEHAIVLVCTSLVVFMLLHTQILFVPSNEIY